MGKSIVQNSFYYLMENTVFIDGYMEFKNHGATGYYSPDIILACHDTEELEYLSDVIYTISEGKIVK